MKRILPLVVLIAFAFTTASVPASHNKGSTVKVETKMKDAPVQTLDVIAPAVAADYIEMPALVFAADDTPLDVYPEATASVVYGRINDPPDKSHGGQLIFYHLRC